MRLEDWKSKYSDSYGESFIVADSMPITFKEFSNYTADQINAKHPGSVPVFLAKAILGGDLIKLLTTSMKVSNKKISLFGFRDWDSINLARK